MFDPSHPAMQEAMKSYQETMNRVVDEKIETLKHTALENKEHGLYDALSSINSDNIMIARQKLDSLGYRLELDSPEPRVDSSDGSFTILVNPSDFKILVYKKIIEI